MEIITTVEAGVSAKAVFRDGEVKLSLSASSSYGEGRAATVSIEEGFPKEALAEFEALFTALIEANQDLLVQKLEAGRSEAIMAAARMGEL